MSKSSLLLYALDAFRAHFNVLAVEHRGSVIDHRSYISDSIFMRDLTRYFGNKGRPSETGNVPHAKEFTLVY
jgi:hypothetical protein